MRAWVQTEKHDDAIFVVLKIQVNEHARRECWVGIYEPAHLEQAEILANELAATLGIEYVGFAF